MLKHPLAEKLQQLRLHGMAKTLTEQQEQATMNSLNFEERLSLLIDREITERDNRRLQARLKKAKLKYDSCFEDIDYQTPRGLDQSLCAMLSDSQWLASHRNLLIVGPTGTGKTFLACAFAHKACLLGYSAQYYRLPRLLPELQLGKQDGRYSKFLQGFTKIDCLILDDFGLTPFNDEHRRDLLEVLDERHERRSTIITSQLPIKLWHETIGNGTLADAILDRLVHNAYRLNMWGESMRKRKAVLTREVKSR